MLVGGEGLVIFCQACGAGCAEGARFCSACGAAVVAAGRRSERKIITVMFCDLVGFTSITERADPEDVDELLRAFSALVREVTASFGGVVEKFIGDAAVAVFGIPVAHEDDPERAVRAGLRIVERVPELRGVGDAGVQVRIGVNTGRALIHLDVDPLSGHGFVLGDAVNTAARLQSLAPPMGVVVGEATHGLTAELFEYESLAPVKLKGKSAPVSPWLARRPLTRTGLEGRTSRTLMVGRDEEMAELKRHIDDIADGGTPRLVLLVGEAGIGKSRLVYELARYTDALPTLFSWRTGVCQPFGQTTPFLALSQIVRAHAGVLESDGETTSRQAGSDAERDGERDWLAARLRPLLGIDAPEAALEENLAAWERVLEELAAQGPTVLIFEDLHWADDGLLRFLDGLMDHIASVPLLVLLTARPEVLERAPDLAASGPRRSRLQVRSLESGHVERLAEVLLEEAGLPVVLVDECPPALRRQPLLRGGVRAVPCRSGSSSWGVGGRWAARDPGDASSTHRRSPRHAGPGLQSTPRRCLGHGARVLARGAQRDGGLTSDAVDDELRELVDRELVRRLPRSSIEDETEYTFVHALTRDVAYEELPRAVKAAKHAGVAAWLEETVGDRRDEMAGMLAHHWVKALELSLATHEERIAKASLEPAITSLMRAGDCSLALDVTIAEGRYRHALDLAADDGPQRPALLVRWARALLDGGRIGDSLAAFEEGIAGLRRQESAACPADLPATALALGHYWTALSLAGDMVRAGQVLGEALALLGEERGAARVELLSQVGGSLHGHGDGGRSRTSRRGRARTGVSARAARARPGARRPGIVPVRRV